MSTCLDCLLHSRRWVYGYYLAIISKFIGAKVDEPGLILFPRLVYIMGETKSNRISPL